MKKVIIGAIAILTVMNGVALYKTQQLKDAQEKHIKAEIIYEQQLFDAQKKYIEAEICRVNAIFYLIASPAFQDKAVREKLQADMKQACEKYKAIEED